MNDLPLDGAPQGEVVARAPRPTRGYLKDPEGSAGLRGGGWLHTGDLAVIDEAGCPWITDRLKDVINAGGGWLSSVDLENLILGHSGVAELAVIGVPDPKWAERPLAVVVARAGHEPSEAEIKAMLRDLAEARVISRCWVPEHVVLAEALPRTSVGEIDKKAVRRAYAG